MLAALTGYGKGGETTEELQFVWNKNTKLKSVFAEPQKIDAPLDRVWKYITSI